MLIALLKPTNRCKSNWAVRGPLMSTIDHGFCTEVQTEEENKAKQQNKRHELGRPSRPRKRRRHQEMIERWGARAW